MPFARVIPACVASAVPYESSSNGIPLATGESGGWPLGVPRLRRSGVRASINAGALRRGEEGDTTRRRRGRTIDNRALFSSRSLICAEIAADSGQSTLAVLPSLKYRQLTVQCSAVLYPLPSYRPPSSAQTSSSFQPHSGDPPSLLPFLRDLHRPATCPASHRCVVIVFRVGHCSTRI